MRKKELKILIACEESQAVTIAFRNLGFTAFSNDIIECSGGHPEWHIQGDAIEQAYSGKWDVMIAHPPCTHLATSGARWFTEGKKPWSWQDDALYFVFQLMSAPVVHIAVENPVSVISSKITKPTQIINPYQFGHKEQKKTCLWLFNLPKLVETNNVYDEMMLLPRRERERIHWLKRSPDRAKLRSKTFTGVASAMAIQWGDYLVEKYGLI